METVQRTSPAARDQPAAGSATCARSAAPGIGEMAAGFTLIDLWGGHVSLPSFRGRSVLVLIWNPGFHYRQHLLRHLRAWEASPRVDAPPFLLVSTGSQEDNRKLGPRSTVVLEAQDRGVRRSFGAEGTPTPVLLDGDGRIASGLAAGSSAILELVSPWYTPAEERFELTIGMAPYNDFDGVYFTLEALKLYQDLENTELLVIDNDGCDDTERLVKNWVGGRYIRALDATGTAAPRELVFREARGEAVLCVDCHVLLAPGAFVRLKQYYRDHLDSLDLLQGPLLFDDAKLTATHFDPVWRDQIWGTWATDPRGADPDGEPFEVPMQGLGLFSCRKSAWQGFHPGFRACGGEEGNIHEKFRQAGGRCLCLPWLRWIHRVSRPGRVAYPLTLEDKLRNYVLGHNELGLNLAPVIEHFSQYLPEERVRAIADEALADEALAEEALAEEDALLALDKAG